jgi:S-adenosylmethionine-diacylglycerol 3-amino-3-carboxypropyl transferase
MIEATEGCKPPVRRPVIHLSRHRDTRLRNVLAGDSPVMTDLSSELGFRRNGQLRKAVYQNRALSRAGFSERLFALLFTGLVYPQIWEDPEVDIEAMDLLEGHRIVTIASGGCNVLAYLTRSPAHIDAVDLNRAHIALNQLKLAAVKHLPAQADLFRSAASAASSRKSLRRSSTAS